MFLGTGETLSTRVYRRAPPASAKGPGIALVAHGGMAAVKDAQAFEMGSIWHAN